MSKRAGQIVTLDELIDEVGADAARFTLLSFSNDSAMNFDIEVVKQQTMENPVYYVQYGHARIASILRKAAERGVDRLPIEDVDLSVLAHDAGAVAPARAGRRAGRDRGGGAQQRAPHRLTHAVQDLAATFHRFYTECHVIDRRRARAHAGAAVALRRDEAGDREPAGAAGRVRARSRWNARMAEQRRPEVALAAVALVASRGLRPRGPAWWPGCRPTTSPRGSARRSSSSMRTTCARAAAPPRPRFGRTLYAVKAFTAHAVIRIALEEGLDLLAATGGEVEACLRAGAPASRVVLHGNNKSDDELALAVRARLSLVIADGPEELRPPGRRRARERAGCSPCCCASSPTWRCRPTRRSPPVTRARSSAPRCAEAVDVVRDAVGPRRGAVRRASTRTSARRCRSSSPTSRSLDVLVELPSRMRDEADVEVPVARRRRRLRRHVRGRARRSDPPNVAAAVARAPRANAAPASGLPPPS